MLYRVFEMEGFAMNDLPDYGLWQLVIINSVIVLIFVFSFFRPQSRRDWRTFGAFAAFIVSMFTEMYGFPLTIYLLSGWLVSRFPEIDWFSHDSSHLLQTLLGWQGNAHFGPLHTVSNILVLGGLALLAVSWKVLFRAQRNYQIACTGPYAKIRHPQYAAFMIIMIGFLLQWPTIPTLIMFPIMVVVYSRLARREEREAFEQFGASYAQYAREIPRFIPRIGWV
jgi:protein-S-isoprenylcysteine O-methyltransferase Ste14